MQVVVVGLPFAALRLDYDNLVAIEIRPDRIPQRRDEEARSGTRASRARRDARNSLRGWTLALEVAVALGTLAAICTGCAILNLLASALGLGLREENLFWFFGGAILSLIGSLLAFLLEMLVAGRNMLRQIRMDKPSPDSD